MSVNQDAIGQQIGAPPFARAAIASEWWAPPLVAGPLDVEFDSVVLPPSFTLFNVQSSPAVIVSPLSGVDWLTQPAAGNARIQANLNAKRSWLCCQPRCENVRWFYAQKIALTGTDGYTFRSRILTNTQTQILQNNASVMRFCMAKDDGTGTKPTFISDGWCLGWESDPNAMQIETNTLKAAVNTTLWLSGDKDFPEWTLDFEFVAVLNSGSLTNTWDFFMRSSNYTWLIGQATASTIGIRQGDTIWVGWDFVGLDGIPAGSTRAPILCADYMRVSSTQSGFLP